MAPHPDQQLEWPTARPCQRCRCLQMGVCYKIASTGDDYVKVWAANSRVNEVVSQWQHEHGLVVTTTSANNPALAQPPAKPPAPE